MEVDSATHCDELSAPGAPVFENFISLSSSVSADTASALHSGWQLLTGTLSNALQRVDVMQKKAYQLQQAATCKLHALNDAVQTLADEASNTIDQLLSADRQRDSIEIPQSAAFELAWQHLDGQQYTDTLHQLKTSCTFATQRNLSKLCTAAHRQRAAEAIQRVEPQSVERSAAHTSSTTSSPLSKLAADIENSVDMCQQQLSSIANAFHTLCTDSTSSAADVLEACMQCQIELLTCYIESIAQLTISIQQYTTSTLSRLLDNNDHTVPPSFGQRAVYCQGVMGDVCVVLQRNRDRIRALRHTTNQYVQAAVAACPSQCSAGFDRCVLLSQSIAMDLQRNTDMAEQQMQPCIQAWQAVLTLILTDAAVGEQPTVGLNDEEDSIPVTVYGVAEAGAAAAPLHAVDVLSALRDIMPPIENSDVFTQLQQ